MTSRKRKFSRQVAAPKGSAGRPTLSPEFYEIRLAGEPFRLPIVQLDENTAIAHLIVFNMGIRFGELVGKAMARRFAALKPDIVVGSATLGIPVAIEVSRHLGLDRYVILQKSPKFSLADALSEEVKSITTPLPQRLLLDRKSISVIQGRRVVVVDDVVTSGSSIAAAIRLMRRAGANVIGVGVILTEGHAWRAALGEDARLIEGLDHIPQFNVLNAVATPILETQAELA
ncbi:MAG: phosphoribosyltransferase family protein [Steroidobacteraceae bacterium]|jgi:adenine phosphoribosyltransferase